MLDFVRVEGSKTGKSGFGVELGGAQRTLSIQCPAFARSHCNMPVDFAVLGILALGYALIASISIDVSLVPMHECVRVGSHIRLKASWFMLGLSRQLLVLLMHRGSSEHFP